YASPDRGSREWGYVAGSRHRIDLRLYTTAAEPELAAEALASGWERTQQKTLALDRIERQAAAEPLPAAAAAPATRDDEEQRVLTALRQERERLRELADGYPAGEARTLAQLARQTEQAREAREQAAARLAQARQAVRGARLWQRERLAEARAGGAWGATERAGWGGRAPEARPTGRGDRA